MDGFSGYLDGSLLNHAFGGPTYTPPTTIWVAALTTMPTDRTGTALVEASGGGYARFGVANTGAFAAATTGAAGATKVTAMNMTFPTATGNWSAPVVGIALNDSSTAGNWLLWYTLAVSQTIVSGDTLPFVAGTPTMALS